MWTHHSTDGLNIYLLARSLFVVVYYNTEDKQNIYESGPWFWGNVGLFMQPFPATFDPITVSISMAPVWVRLPNLPLHLWNLPMLSSIGNALGKFYRHNPESINFYKTTYA